MKTRQHLRVPLLLNIKFKILEKDEDFVATRIEDISWGGAFIITDAPVEAEDRVIMQMVLDEDNVSLELWGTAIRIRKEQDGFRAGVGIEFDRLDEDSRSLIQRIINDEVNKLIAVS